MDSSQSTNNDNPNHSSEKVQQPTPTEAIDLQDLKPLPIKTSHTKLYLIVGCLFAVCAIVFGSLLYWQKQKSKDENALQTDTSQKSVETQQNSDKNDAQTDQTQINYSTFETDLLDLAADSKHADEPIATVISSKINELIDVPANFSIVYPGVSATVPKNAELVDLGDGILAILVDNGYKLSPKSNYELDYSKDDLRYASGVYENDTQECIVALGVDQLSVTCIEKAAADKVDTSLIGELYAAYRDDHNSASEIDYQPMIAAPDKVVDIDGAQRVKTSLGSYDESNGVYIYLPSGGGIDFYRINAQDQWQIIYTGQSIKKCTDYPSNSALVLYEEDTCLDNESKQTTVAKYYAN
ncbi:hypothetical protein KC878_02075 [Candidatus Saccharibacteria bacterium]|nr:hypothetical protein [Candidatus Saccharibacteria bacterium]MCB9821513.1 hypothetical protein [Candidatus Nomurabacteria bacterium]